ncbi:MAG: hypothetical protein K8R87_03195 [Verrucomicrobia bacterium]|nr:hypothetical protein [Verrucomicrobiota bacterium]
MPGPTLKTGTRANLCLPGETGREYWRLETTGGWKKVEVADGTGGGVFAIEALALDSVPFWAVAPQDGKLDLAAVATLKWETLGANEAGDGKSWTHWEAGRSENRVLVASAGLADLPEAPWAGQRPDSFELSPRLFPLPDGEAVIWKELGRLVIAFARGETLLHFSVLSARRLDVEAAQEIRALCLGLEVQGFLTRPSGIRVWTKPEPGFADAVKDALGVRAWIEARPLPVLPEKPGGIFPPEMARAAQGRAKRRRTAQIITALVALYILSFAAWSGWLYWRGQNVTKQTAELEKRRPEIESVRQMQTRWQVLEPATNADSYPTELFHRVASLLPDEGIQLKEFFLESNKLVVSGKASTITHAKKFQADLTNDAGLHQYTWNFPQPTILEDNQASFRAEGTLGTGGEVP